MTRHHLVPQMLLKRFATPQRQIIMVPRRPPHMPMTTSVKTACAECDFYKIPTEDLAESARGGHDPEIVERLLASFEGDADPLITAMIDGHFPPSHSERLTLSLFVALQMTRGWRFREDVNEFGTVLMREEASMIPEREIRDWLRKHGEPWDRDSVRRFRDRMISPEVGPRLTMTQSYAVQAALRAAVEDLGHRLIERPWRLLRFTDDVLLTSDNPVGIWSPAPDGTYPTIGRGNAHMIYLPLDRRTALAFATHGRDRVSYPGSTRVRQINMSVIEDARRWIFHHPDDEPLANITIPPPMQLVHEIVGVREDGDGTINELHRLARRPGSSAVTSDAPDGR